MFVRPYWTTQCGVVAKTTFLLMMFSQLEIL
jgi:hypothetical protein